MQLMRYDQGNALDGEEEQEAAHNLQAMWKAELSHPPQGVLCLRLRQVRKGQEVRLAVEDRRRQEKEVGFYF